MREKPDGRTERRAVRFRFEGAGPLGKLQAGFDPFQGEASMPDSLGLAGEVFHHGHAFFQRLYA